MHQEKFCKLYIYVIPGSVSYMSESSQQIIFTSSEPSLAMVYDAKTGLHSVYKIRKALIEECQAICGNDTLLSLFNHSANTSSLNIGSNLSVNKNGTNRGHLSPFPFGKKKILYYYGVILLFTRQSL